MKRSNAALVEANRERAKLRALNDAAVAAVHAAEAWGEVARALCMLADRGGNAELAKRANKLTEELVAIGGDIVKAARQQLGEAQ